RSHDQDEQTMWRQAIASGTSTSPGSPARSEGEHDVNDASAHQLNAQLDYLKTFAMRRKLETGYKGTARWLDRDYLVEKDSLGSRAWPRSTLSTAFEYDENVQAVHAVVSQAGCKCD